MKVRVPNWDFSKIRAKWAPVPEFAQSYNAFSIVPAHIEPYLMKVMRRAKDVLDPKHVKLHDDIAIFNKQEMEHCKNHVAFNRALYEQGYEGLRDVEKPYQQDYVRFLKDKSLRFNVAYCEGFEAMGSTAAQVIFEDLDEYLVGADSEALELWKWHLAEEFEHREVCFQVYKTLYGNGPFAYLYRVAVFFFAVKHIHGYTARAQAYLLGVDRASMTEEERQASIAREKAIAKKVGSASKKHLLKVLSPFYDPGKKKVSPGMQQILDRYDNSASAAQ
jgi:uncharacterized protein